MIIGNNNGNNSFTSNFQRRNNLIKEEAKKNQGKVNMFQEDKRIHLASSDATNQKMMLDKSFAMLQERYRNGLITIDEFNKKCTQLNKFREKNK
ncbi:MAG: hypothetical protein IKE70_00060 [Bacilli bacterium]|nr:hypothetical protein [Bacilli bacterium]